MPKGVERRSDTNWRAEPLPGGGEASQQYRAGVAPRKGSAPKPMTPCGPLDVRFVHNKVNLPGGAGPARGFEIASIRPQPGILYPGVSVRWGCDYPWLITEGIIQIRVWANQAFPYPIAERAQTPRWPVLLPQCWEDNTNIRVLAFWTDPSLTAFSQIPVWAELALGTEEPPNFDNNSPLRVRRRQADIVPITVLPGSAFAAVSPGVIRPTAGKFYAQVDPSGAVPTSGRPQFSFATVRGSGVAANIAGNLLNGGGLNPPTEIEVDDLRDVFLGDPLAQLPAPTVVNVHREVWA